MTETVTDSNIANIARDMRELRSMLTQVVNYMNEAESEVPEKMRRFMMYYHDVKDIVDMHHQLGQVPPAYLMREIERCDDRYRHLLEDLNTDTGAFERVRQDMSKREGNRWDHERLLPKYSSKENAK
ncbi:MAG: hypothetical protein P4L50_00245 [Anaerolineaceae bacterium]|nr:hypothetical protein [Anaerolineaceae bacterium]